MGVDNALEDSLSALWITKLVLQLGKFGDGLEICKELSANEMKLLLKDLLRLRFSRLIRLRGNIFRDCSSSLRLR